MRRNSKEWVVSLSWNTVPDVAVSGRSSLYCASDETSSGRSNTWVMGYVSSQKSVGDWRHD
jgi:hypothetical protein